MMKYRLQTGIMTAEIIAYEEFKQTKPYLRIPLYLRFRVTRKLDKSRELWLILIVFIIQSVSDGKVNILGGHSIGHSKQKIVYVHVSYSERFLR
jgi:hypothetical protein